VNQVQRDNDGHKNKDDSDQETGILRRSGNALRAVYKNLAAFFQMEGQLALRGKMQAVGIAADIEDIYDIFDDFAECECDDCKIVTPEAEDRYADKCAEQCRGKPADDQRKREADPGVWNGVFEEDREERAGKCSDAHEPGMAKAKLA